METALMDNINDTSYKQHMTGSSISKGKRGIVVSIPRSHIYYRTSNKGNISEARLIMAEHLGRNLASQEVIVRKDNNPDNNELSNLILMTRKQANMVTRKRRLTSSYERLRIEIFSIDQYLTEHGINPDTLNSLDKTVDRCRLVDNDRELYERARRNRRSDSEEQEEVVSPLIIWHRY